MTQYYAHSLEGKTEKHWQPLEKHLSNVANVAGEFAAKFGSREWGYLAGLWHDLGKYNPAFQKKIRENSKARVDHSTAGALLADDKNKMGIIIAYLVAGHHAGLADYLSELGSQSDLENRLSNKVLLDEIKNYLPEKLLSREIPYFKFANKIDASLWIRMLYSCLVDADYLDTEAFMDCEKSRKRGVFHDLQSLNVLYESYMNKKQSSVIKSNINKIRNKIFMQCISAAELKPGHFSLDVPTGGGKTLASLGFALRHAKKYQKNRIIYVIPYTSIIEQTADQFREIFGDQIIEHHSNLEIKQDDRNFDEENQYMLACENWDAPIIVTTSVQFLESLFSNRSSRCRKLHRIVNSVVIFDEAQLLPPDYLHPILNCLEELKNTYGVTILLSTATQPALGEKHFGGDENGKVFKGLKEVREIIKAPKKLHEDLKRVEVELPDNLLTPQDWDSLADELKQYEQLLCIVNRRDDCRLLFEKMPKGTIHLSALMCGQHRSTVIKEIKEKLINAETVRVISTQLVEAGVDVDFPVVYRALAGLDSIAQAAGRCNREGKLEKGLLKVFVPSSKTPNGHLSQTAEIARIMLEKYRNNPIERSRFEEFFKELYWLKGDRLDKQDIVSDLTPHGKTLGIRFKTAAQKFRIIDDRQSRSVLVAYREGARFIQQLKKTGPQKWLMRKFQRYVVNVPVYLHKRLQSEGAVFEIYPGIYIQGHQGMYDEKLGFCPDKSLVYEPDELIG